MVAVNAISSIRALDPGLSSPAAGVAAVTGTGPADAAAVDLDNARRARTSGDTADGTSFLDTIGGAIEALNEQLLAADRSAAEFAAGGSADLHTVMLDMQQASIGLQVGIAVRDRLLDAYQQLMHLQV